MKLGYGAYEPRPELAGIVNESGACAVLLFHRALSLADQIAPGIEIIGRDGWTQAEQDDMLLSSNDLDFLRAMGRVYAGGLCEWFPRVAVWQALNEVMRKGSRDWLERQVAWELGFLDGLRGERTGCVLNAPPGVEPIPGESFFEEYATIVKPLFEHPKCKYWGRHVYSKHRTAHLWDDPDYYALRHRQIAAGLRARGVRVPPIAITELGWADGWRATGFPDHEAADDLRWFGEQIQHDPDIASAHLFCLGNSGGWQEHNVEGSGIVGAVREWNAGHPVVYTPNNYPEVTPVPEDKIDMLFQQNALIVAALIDFRHGRFEGASGMDGKIVALNGGILPAGWAPNYPPK